MIPVHYRHLQVHQNQFVEFLATTFVEVSANHVYGDFSIHGLVWNQVVIFLQELLQGKDVEGCIVNYEDSIATSARGLGGKLHEIERVLVTILPERGRVVFLFFYVVDEYFRCYTLTARSRVINIFRDAFDNS